MPVFRVPVTVTETVGVYVEADTPQQARAQARDASAWIQQDDDSVLHVSVNTKRAIRRVRDPRLGRGPIVKE